MTRREAEAVARFMEALPEWYSDPTESDEGLTSDTLGLTVSL
jgi:hypothetical protein